MDSIGNMEPNDFLQLIEKSFTNKYVTKEDIKEFVTKKELIEIVDEKTNHSTSKIRSAVIESVSEANEKSRIHCREDTENYFSLIGIDLNRPQEMQELIVNLKKTTKNSEHARKMFVGSIIKTLVIGVAAVLIAGIFAYSGGYIK